MKDLICNLSYFVHIENVSIINVELEPELIRETISALNTKAHKTRLEIAEKGRELETLLSRVKKLELAVTKDGNVRNAQVQIDLSSDFKPVEVTESGRRPYGTSGETILSVLKGANGAFMKIKSIVELSGCAYGSAYRILRQFEKEKKARRDENGAWAQY